MELYSLKDIAKKTDVRPSTVEYYIQLDIMKVEYSTEAGYRLFTEKGLNRLQKILSLKNEGLSLKDIQRKFR